MMITVACFLAATNLFAQDNVSNEQESSKGFKKENIFTGGNALLSLSGVYTAIGVSPYLGYSVNKWVDVAVNINTNYSSQRDVYVVNNKLRQFTYGAGAFARLYPVKVLFLQAQYEHNFTAQKYIAQPNSGYQTAKDNIDANSVLLGGGICSGRRPGNNNFYYFSLMFDVAHIYGSPYLDYLKRSIPIYKAGVNIALFQGKHHHRL